MDIFDFSQYSESFLKIRTKNGRIIPFKPNEPQKRLLSVIEGERKAGRPVRIIILKARQMGFSTLTEGVLFHSTITSENTTSLVIAHKEEAAAGLFAMNKLFYDELPERIRPMRNTASTKEMVFENPDKGSAEKGLRSRIRSATAGGRGVGRSETITNIHASEVAFWEGDKKAILNGLMQAVPDSPGTMVILESTANGCDYFKELWDRAVNGDNDFVPVFFPWHEMKEYRRKYDGFQLTKAETVLKKAYNLDNEQLAWRRWCIRNNCGGDEQLFRQEYPSAPEEAFILTGRCIFDKEKISARLAVLRGRKEPVIGMFTAKEKDGRLEDIRFHRQKDGFVRIYSKPQTGHSYVIGGDTAGEGSDYFTAQVLDSADGKQVCVLRQQSDEDEYARQVYCLGKYYNNALTAIETNFSTYPVKELARLGYDNLYVRRQEDSYTNRILNSYGFKTTMVTRPLIISGLVKFVREESNKLNDSETLREMLSFVKNSHGRAEAEYGAHDDLVMALAIAVYVLPEAIQAEEEEISEGVIWTADMWEDYENSDEEGKRYLIKRYGKPQ